MKLSKQAKVLAEDLGLDEVDAVVMELKSKLYQQAAKSIQKSNISTIQAAQNSSNQPFEHPTIKAPHN